MTPSFGWLVSVEKLQAGDRVRTRVDDPAFKILQIGEVREDGFRDAVIAFEPTQWVDDSPRQMPLSVLLKYLVDTREEFDAITAR
jgi:hypothetical protein